MVKGYVLAISALFYIQSVFGYQDVRNNLKGKTIVELSKSQYRELQAEFGHHMDMIHKTDEISSIIVPSHIVDSLPMPVKDVTEHWIKKTEDNLNTENLFCNEPSKICAARNTEDFFSTYQELASLTERIDGLVSAASDIATRKVIGQTSEGRDMHVIEIGDQTKPLAYFMCNIHAREWLSPMYCAYMIEMLVANGGHRLLSKFSFAIIPTGNPDGYEFSRTEDNFWRKTRNINEGSDCIGTDPNRNYANNHCGPGTSNRPCSDIFCGLEPFSTNEVRNINEYAKTVQNRLITWIDFHSFASMWLSPLGFATGTPPAVDYDRMEQCMDAAATALKAVNGLQYDFGGAADLLSVAAGASDDFFYFDYGVIYSYTVEMRGNSFQPPASNIILNNVELFAGMVGQMDCIAEIENIVGDAKEEAPLEESESGVATIGVILILLGIGIVGTFVMFLYLEKTRKKPEIATAKAISA